MRSVAILGIVEHLVRVFNPTVRGFGLRPFGVMSYLINALHVAAKYGEEWERLWSEPEETKAHY
jgi:hypothetical protein